MIFLYCPSANHYSGERILLPGKFMLHISDEFGGAFNGYAVIVSDVTSVYPAGYYFYKEYYQHIYAPDEETLSYHWEDNAIIPLTRHGIEY